LIFILKQYNNISETKLNEIKTQYESEYLTGKCVALRIEYDVRRA